MDFTEGFLEFKVHRMLCLFCQVGKKAHYDVQHDDFIQVLNMKGLKVKLKETPHTHVLGGVQLEP